MMRPLAFLLVVLLAVCTARASDPAPVPGDATAAGSEFDAIREQLVALDIEAALEAVNRILERPGLPEATRIDALDLRAQAHAASDDLDAAEKDYRAILELFAGYAPRHDVTSKKAMDRFFKTRVSMIGTIHLDVDPKDAEIRVDGCTVSVSADGSFPAVSGVRSLRVTRRGFDSQDVDLRSVAGQETLVKIRLVPNARSLVVRTDVEGVAVAMDGVASGATTKAGGPGGDPGAPATLVIEDAAIGEHELRLSKACFATETLQEIVSVDLADRSPRVLRVVAMRPARARVAVTGALYEGELRVDGERVASVPLTSFEMCPGTRTIEVVASGRIVWSGILAAEESDLVLDLAPRPSVVLVGSAWPKSWDSVMAAWSLRDRVDPPAGADLTTREGWSAVSFPPGTDMAIGVIPRSGIAGDDRTVLYGPSLQAVEELASPPRPTRPSWSVATLGAVLVDQEGGSVVLASVAPAGPAARAGLLSGDRLVAIAGRAVSNAAAARDAVMASGIEQELVLQIASPSGSLSEVSCRTAAEPRLAPPPGDDPSRVARAAWASVSGAAGGPEAALAFGNLARLLERSGRGMEALEAWRRVRAVGSGALAARAAYAVGAGLQAAGKTVEALEAFRQAEAVGKQAGDLALEAAAIDRLADLGVAPR